MSCIPISELSAYLGRDFFTICDLNSFFDLPKVYRRLYDEKNVRINDKKQIIITNYIDSVSGSKSVCPIFVKSRRLSRNNASCDRYTHAQKQCEKGLFFL